MKNTSYAAVYDRDFTDERKSILAMQQNLDAEYRAAILAEQKKRQPRKRTHFEPLADAIQEEILERFRSSATYKEIMRLDAEVDREKENREKLLTAMAEGVVFEPVECMHRVKFSSSYGYSSQGYGAMRYAKGVLEPHADHLRGLGFEVHIREVNYQPGTGQFACPSADYELWANCPPWMFDAASRRLTLGAAVDSWKARQINPLVYNPFLPDWARL